MIDIIVVAGLSGAGRSQAADDLEDLGWFVVDNLPVVLIDKVVELSGESGGEISKLCLVVGNAKHQAGILEAVSTLRSQGHNVRILFLEASTRELVRRYEATRRKHPLGDGNTGLEAIIESERVATNPVKAVADLVIDTTGLSIHQLKNQLVHLFGPENPNDSMQLSVVSFGFKNGVPIDVDMVLDVRFLPNPHWDEELRPYSGLDAPIREFVMQQEVTSEFLGRVNDLLALILPSYISEGRSYLTVGVGCTGGRHRSVAIAEEIANGLKNMGFHPRVVHRDINA